MRRRGRREGLLALNGVLLAMLAGLVLSGEPGRAQVETSARARGSYLLVGGETTGSNSNTVYIVDTTNEELIAVRWNQTTGSLDRLGFRSLEVDAGRPRIMGPR